MKNGKWLIAVGFAEVVVRKWVGAVNEQS